jgi:hypothetical protein
VLVGLLAGTWVGSNYSAQSAHDRAAQHPSELQFQIVPTSTDPDSLRPAARGSRHEPAHFAVASLAEPAASELGFVAVRSDAIRSPEPVLADSL